MGTYRSPPGGAALCQVQTPLRTDHHARSEDFSTPTPPRARRGRSLTDLDDATLVARAQDGSLRAFEVLVERHQRTMFNLAYRILQERGAAQDAVQEAFLAAWRRLGAFRADAAFSSWMYRIVTNACLNAARKVRRVAPLDDPAVGSRHRLGNADPEQVAERRDELRALRTAVAHLPVEQRVCWVLREGEGMGYQEIAEVVGTTPDTVRGRLYRARQQLMESMRPWR